MADETVSVLTNQTAIPLTSHALLVRCDLHQSDDPFLQLRWSEPDSLLN